MTITRVTAKKSDKYNWTFKSLVTPELIKEYVNGCRQGEDDEVIQAARDYIAQRRIETAEVIKNHYGKQTWTMGSAIEGIPEAIEVFEGRAIWALKRVNKMLKEKGLISK